MLSLDDPAWDKLYPMAGDTCEMLATLAALGKAKSDERFARALTHLMVMVWHDNDSCPAALAIAPHLAALCAGASLDRKARCIHCIALFEVARHRALGLGIGPVVPTDIDAEYAATIRRLPDFVASCLGELWDFASATKLAGALLVAKGHPAEGYEVMQLRSVAEREADSGSAESGGIPW